MLQPCTAASCKQAACGKQSSTRESLQPAICRTAGRKRSKEHCGESCMKPLQTKWHNKYLNQPLSGPVTCSLTPPHSGKSHITLSVALYLVPSSFRLPQVPERSVYVAANCTAPPFHAWRASCKLFEQCNKGAARVAQAVYLAHNIDTAVAVMVQPARASTE